MSLDRRQGVLKKLVLIQFSQTFFTPKDIFITIIFFKSRLCRMKEKREKIS